MQPSGLTSFILFFEYFVCLFLERGEGREKGNERNIDTRENIDRLPLATPPNQGRGPQPRQVPWLGIEWATFQFVELRPVH